jgi:hypothetical protein
MISNKNSLDFQSWQSCYTANFYWIIKGNEFDAVGLYMSFQNGDWTINDWTISEFWCRLKKFLCKFLLIYLSPTRRGGKLRKKLFYNHIYTLRKTLADNQESAK